MSRRKTTSAASLGRANHLVRRTGRSEDLVRRLNQAERRAEMAEAALHSYQRREDSMRTQRLHLSDGLRALQETLDHYIDQFQKAPIAFLTLDRAGMIREANRATRELLGVDGPGPVGWPLRSFVVTAERGRIVHHLRRCREEGQAVTQLFIAHPFEGSVPIELVSRRGRGFPETFPTTVFDRRERELAESARAGYESQEKEFSEERAEREQLMAIVSHELRGPLAAMLAAVEALPGARAAEQREQVIDVIRRNILIEARLIDDLLDATRIARGKMSMECRPTDVHQAMRDALEMFVGQAAHKSITVQVKLDAERHVVTGDPTRLRQVFWNLIKNAIKFTPEGGRIELQSWTRDKRVLLEVGDSGPGIDDDVLPRLFKAFEQGSRRRSGTDGGLGLGLAISRGIVELHLGRIVASSGGPGRGARFVVELPLYTGAECAEPIHNDGVEPTRTAARILLVEDNKDMAVALSIALGQLGYQVEVADSATQALRSAPERFDVLVSDVGLPDGNGHDLLRALRRRGPVKAIALSGYGTEQDQGASREAGFAAHLTKPIDLDTLTSTIERLLARPGAPAPV